MKSYLDIANSTLLYILALSFIAFVFAMCIVFFLRAYKRGIEIGMTKEKLKNTIKQSAVFSITPSIPIVIGLIAMAPILGIPFPFMRLSIIGSVQYELIAAERGAQSMGITSLGGAGYTPEVFANSMWIMSIGIIWGLVACIFFMKRLQKGVSTMKEKDNKWASILITALFFGMVSVFVGSPIASGGLPMVTIFVSAFLMLLLTQVAKRINWLNNFSLSLSMIISMVLAIFIDKII